MGQLDPLLIDNRYPPVNDECMVGDYITRCIWYNCYQLLGPPPEYQPFGNPGDYPNTDWLNWAWIDGDVIIQQLPFDDVPKCGDCPTLPFIKTWLQNNPTKRFPEIVRDPVAYLQLKQYVELNGGKLKIGVPTVDLDERITYQGKKYILKNHNFTWIELIRDDLALLNGSIPYEPWKYICADGATGQQFPCFDNATMPWWQEPKDYKYDDLQDRNDCLIWPPANTSYHCENLYDLDDKNPKNKPIEVNTYGPSKEFLSVYQKWVDANKNHPQFNADFKDAVILFYGYIDGGLDPITKQPTYTNGQGVPDPGVVKVFLETYILDSAYKLIRDPDSRVTDQKDRRRKYIYLTPAPAFTNPPPPVSNKNLLITFNMMTCQLVEEIVNREPEIAIPEIITIKYIPNTASLLSSTDPTAFSKLKLETQKRFPECTNGTCCFMSVDAKSVYRIGCLSNMSSEECNTNRLNETLLSDPENKVVVVESYYTNGVDCSEANCQFDIPRLTPSALGTCCFEDPLYPGFADHPWGCKINTQLECSNIEGFWQPAQPDGLGGFNPPSCSSGGIQTVAIDGLTSTTIFFGPRDCSIYNMPFDNPGVVNGACCSIVATKTIDSLILTNSVIHTKTVTIPGYSRTGYYIAPSDVNFTMLNDGSVVKLCFNNRTVFNDYMTSVDYDNSKIESDFSVTNNGQVTSGWKTTVNKIEGNCIILSVEKQ